MAEITQSELREEVNLLDFLIVLIKRRFLILSLTLPVLIICIIGYFLYPSWKYNKIPNKEIIKTKCKVMAGPVISNKDAGYELITLFNSAPSLLKAMEKAGYDKIGNFSIDNVDDRRRALDYLDNNFPIRIIDENNQLTIKNYAVNPKNQVIRIIYENDNPELAELFLNHLVDEVNLKISSIIHTKSVPGTDEALIMYESPYSVLESGINISEIKYNYIKKSLILLFTVLFLVSFLAFLMEFVFKIKQDEVQMKKIRKALNKEQS